MIDAACSDSIEPILEILEGKWILLLLRELFNGVKRFGELRRSLDPISPKTLTDRLRMLEEQGILTRTLFSEVPLHVEYQLTERGQRLQPIFAAMKAWLEPGLGVIEAPIVLKRIGNEMRHFVEDEPVHSSSYMEVKFGDGWVGGRYEWSLEKDSPIQIHSDRNEVLYIREGHIVRVKSDLSDDTKQIIRKKAALV
jgi:DNA-binding HxlR family transcriptional regulator